MGMTGIGMIEAERASQIKKHGYNVEHDNKCWSSGQLAMFAAYIREPDKSVLLTARQTGKKWIQHVLAKKPTERLAVAGALYMAERERRGDASYSAVIVAIAGEIDKLLKEEKA